MEQFLQSYQHLAIVVTLAIGLYIVLAHDNLIKKLIGLGLMQLAVFIFFILGAQLQGGIAPILVSPSLGVEHYANPVPHVLILTAIVVNVASTAMGLALAITIDRRYKSLDESEIQERDEEHS